MALIMTITSNKERETEIKQLLLEQGHTVETRPVTLAVLGFVRLEYPHAIMLDWDSSNDLIFHLFSCLRSVVSTPILVILPELEEDKRAALAVKVFSLGADSCCSADSRADEVVARLDALMRRALAYRSFPYPQEALPEATSPEEEGRAISEKEIDFTPLERRIIKILSSNKNTIVPWHYICEKIWGDTDDGKKRRVIQVIYRIRKKLYSSNKKGYIFTYKRKGYLLRKDI